MNSILRHAIAGILALLLAACGGSPDSTQRPNQLMSSVQTASAEVPDSAYEDVVQRMYVGYLGRPADPGGIAFWVAKYKAYGMPLSVGDISASYSSNATVRAFVDAYGTSEESKALYPGDNGAFVAAIYKNLFNREPDVAGKAYWVDALDRGIMTRPIAALYIMGGARSTDIVIIDKKVAVASMFTAALNTLQRRAAYEGMNAAGIAREMLAQVGLDTDISTFKYEDPIYTLLDIASSHKLAAYLGSWSAPCDWYSMDSIAVTALPDTADTAQIAIKTEYFATPTCEGPVVATMTMSAGLVAVHTGTASTSIVYSEGTAAVPATVDLMSITLPAHTTSVTGTAVTHTVINEEAQWCVDLGGGNSSCIQDMGLVPAQGPETGAMYVNGNKLYLLSPVGSIYYADETYTRK